MGCYRPARVLCQNPSMPVRVLRPRSSRRRRPSPPQLRQNPSMPVRVLRRCSCSGRTRTYTDCQNPSMPVRVLRPSTHLTLTGLIHSSESLNARKGIKTTDVEVSAQQAPGQMSESLNARKGIKTDFVIGVEAGIDDPVRIPQCP